MRSLPFAFVLGLAALAGVPMAARAQGTAADYGRSDSLQNLLRPLSPAPAVGARWEDGGKRLWYSVSVSYGVQKTYEVDARTGRITDAPSEPPQSDRNLRAQLPAPLQDRNGPETTITFKNQSKRTVRVYTVDWLRQRTPYGELKPGENREQPTREGHVWLLTDESGHSLAAYQLEKGPGVAVYDGRSPAPRVDYETAAGDGISPDGKWRLTHDHDNLRLQSVADRTQYVTLTTDGTDSDVYETQPSWSPDSKLLAVSRVQPGDHHVVTIVRSSPPDQIQPKLHILDDYLKPGDNIGHEQLVIIDVATHKQVEVDQTLMPNPWQFTDFHWSPDAKTLYFVENERGHKRLRLVAADVATGKVRMVVEESSPTFIDYADKLWVWYLDQTGEALWMSERSGYNHIYRVDLATGKMKPVTQGKWMVRSVERVFPDERQLVLKIMGRNPKQDPYYYHYARVGFDGKGFTMLTEGDGSHALYWAPDRESYLDTYSRVDLPPITELRRASDGKLLATLAKADDKALRATGWTPPERFTAKARDGRTDIYGIIYKPTNFDPAKKYPVVEDIYAGPQDFFVPKTFEAYRSDAKLAELGFIVVKIDGLGTNWRGKAFHDVCYQNLADAGLPDRILWMKAAAKTRPWMDLDRVGIFGTSAGGQSAASAMFRFGDFYKAGVADCGCHDNRMDKIWWNELWMGWPVGKAYADNSNVPVAKNLEGKLYLMVAEDDTNVDPASTMQVVNALIKAGKDFDLLVYPNSEHGVLGHPYAFRRMEDFFVRSLYGAEPRR